MIPIAEIPVLVGFLTFLIVLLGGVTILFWISKKVRRRYENMRTINVTTLDTIKAVHEEIDQTGSWLNEHLDQLRRK